MIALDAPCRNQKMRVPIGALALQIAPVRRVNVELNREPLAVSDAIAKKRGGRRIPMHPSLGRALVALKRGSVTAGPVVRSARGGCMRPTSIVNWFAALFASLELEGCSSHSRRRSFITAAARNAHKTGCSLRDVQLLAGHKSIQVTQGYIDGDTREQRRLVTSL
jgi:integrase/recombinase XerD